ncbi:hypothetical protein WG219_05385 [Ectopseudomonas mendocina]|uniref:Uncharacterized protein n=1 Tax=Ectopseudomonas mendocina TaxID=300 RepID=A0ABZ2RKZ4_ECTME
MSLQVLWVMIQGYAAQWLNGLALFFALAGSWLAIATRARVQRAGLAEQVTLQAWSGDDPTQRLNRFFYCFAFATLMLALMLSWVSTSL